MLATGSTFYIMKIAQIENILDEILNSLDEDEESNENEDFNAYEASGGNFDDAYNIGIRDGEITLARKIKKLIKEPIYINETI